MAMSKEKKIVDFVLEKVIQNLILFEGNYYLNGDKNILFSLSEKERKLLLKRLNK